MVQRALAFLGTKIGISLIVAACLVVGAIFAARAPKEDPVKDQSVVAVDLVRKSLDVDTDGDGLRDWEEAIYGTDPSEADTDADGTGDNDEIKANRSPLIAGAGEGVQIEASASSTAYVSNATDRFSQELFTKYLEAKSSGKEITEDLSNAIAEEIVSQQYEASAKPFDVGSLNLTVDSAQSIKSYGNQVGAIVTTPPVQGAINELVILEKIQNGTASSNDILVLERVMGRYQAMRQALIDMPIPASAASIHAELIQGIEMMYNVCLGITQIESDPIGAYSKIAQYEDALNVITAASLKVKSYFVSRNVVFGAQEGRYVLVQ